MIYKKLANMWLFPRAMVAMALLATATLTGAGARDIWNVDAARSEIRFVASKFKEPLLGTFKSFKIDSTFDPNAPESSHIKVEIDMGSINTGNKKIDELLKKPEWFATESHPVAVFEASKFTKISNNKYAIEGTITLKGKIEKLTMEADVNFADDPSNAGRLVAKANSEIAIKRLAFSIGTGPWADLGAIADEVKVSLKLSASRPK